jgi:hypothetical protein
MALRSAGNGRFEDASSGLPFATRENPAVFSSRAVALADCNADGRLDIVALGEGPRLQPQSREEATAGSGIATFVRQQDGGWTSSGASVVEGMFGASMATADVDGDGKVDLVLAPGTLGDKRIVTRGNGACGWTPETVAAVRTRSYVTAVATGDVDGNGRADVVIGYTEFAGAAPAFGVDVLTRLPNGSWTRRALARDEGRGRIDAVAVGDLNGDAKLDAAAAGLDGLTTVFVGDGTGGFTRERETIVSADRCKVSAIAIGDLDGDRLGDLVIAHAQETSAATPDACPSEGRIVALRTMRAGS